MVSGLDDPAVIHQLTKHLTMGDLSSLMQVDKYKSAVFKHSYNQLVGKYNKQINSDHYFLAIKPEINLHVAYFLIYDDEQDILYMYCLDKIREGDGDPENEDFRTKVQLYNDLIRKQKLLGNSNSSKTVHERVIDIVSNDSTVVHTMAMSKIHILFLLMSVYSELKFLFQTRTVIDGATPSDEVPKSIQHAKNLLTLLQTRLSTIANDPILPNNVFKINRNESINGGGRLPRKSLKCRF